jgi:hypothetical protein
VPFHTQQYDLVLAVRFLEKPFFARHIGGGADGAGASMVRVGGYFLCQAFGTGAAAFGFPKEAGHLLSDGELAGLIHARADAASPAASAATAATSAAASSSGVAFELVCDRLETLPAPDGRPVYNLLARRIR